LNSDQAATKQRPSSDEKKSPYRVRMPAYALA
jgi:hypothetical protein